MVGYTQTTFKYPIVVSDHVAVGAAIKHPVSNRVKQSYVIFDIQTL